MKKGFDFLTSGKSLISKQHDILLVSYALLHTLILLRSDRIKSIGYFLSPLKCDIKNEYYLCFIHLYQLHIVRCCPEFFQWVLGTHVLTRRDPVQGIMLFAAGRTDFAYVLRAILNISLHVS